MNETLINNIEKERYRLNFTQSEMANKLNISLSTYKRLINGELKKVPITVLERLCKLTGKMVFQYTENNYTETQSIINLLTKAPSKALPFIKGILEFEIDFALNNEDYESYISVFIPTGDIKDGMIYDTSNIEKIKISDSYGHIDCGIKITNNNLNPAYNKGDILLIKHEPIRNGDIGIFMNKENRRTYIRQFLYSQPCMLKPINNFGKIFYINQDNEEDVNKWIKFGRVVCKLR